MLENEFFPTPKPVIHKMIEPYLYEGRYLRSLGYILDPSAGAGGILDYLEENCKVRSRELMAIEINQELRYTLQGKEYRVIGSDFLTYAEPCKFGLILMNPPFSEGVKHVLKAWEILADGGHLTALVNAETVRNKYSEERKVLGHLIKEYGSVEELGQCFKDAERPTDVEIALIRLHRPPQESKINFNDLDLEAEDRFSEEEFSANPLAHRDAVKNLVARYNAIQKILVERHQMQSKLDFYLDGIDRAVYETVSAEGEKCLSNKANINKQIRVLKARFWNTLFQKTKIGQKTTSDFQKKFSEFSRNQAAMAFTEENILEVLGLFYLNQNKIFQECLLQIFDTATEYHEKNKVHIEGWKTNKSYRVNKRIIIPWGVSYEALWGFRIGYGKCESFLNDLDKVLCWLSGINSELPEFKGTYGAINAFIHECKRGKSHQEVFESTFLKIRIFKKGTVHLDFKDLGLLATFNQAAAQGKKWIGGGY